MITMMTNTAITIATPRILTINSADSLILFQGRGAKGTRPDLVETLYWKTLRRVKMRMLF